MNGDSYCAVDLAALMNQHEARNAIATIVTTPVDDPSRYSRITLGPQDLILSISEKGDASGPAYINCGIYVFSRRVLALIPAGAYCSMEQDVFPLLAGRDLYAFKTSGAFIDIGIPSDLRRARSVLRNVSVT